MRHSLVAAGLQQDDRGRLVRSHAAKGVGVAQAAAAKITAK